MSAHTPADWHWRQMGDDWYLMGDHGMRPVVLGAQGHRKSSGPPPRGVFVLRDPERNLLIPFDPKHPDARLIAAAPDLYQALREAVSYIHTCAERDIVPNIGGQGYGEACAAIRKAEGR